MYHSSMSKKLTKKEQRAKNIERYIAKLLSEIPKDKLFGNEEVIKQLKSLQAILNEIEVGTICKRCNGTGEMDHDCDCPYCSADVEECDECDEGYVFMKLDDHL